MGGNINFTPGSPAALDKPLVMLYRDENRPEPVLACGAFSWNNRIDHWGPDDRFDCPRDE